MIGYSSWRHCCSYVSVFEHAEADGSGSLLRGITRLLTKINAARCIQKHNHSPTTEQVRRQRVVASSSWHDQLGFLRKARQAKKKVVRAECRISQLYNPNGWSPPPPRLSSSFEFGWVINSVNILYCHPPYWTCEVMKDKSARSVSMECLHPLQIYFFFRIHRADVLYYLFFLPIANKMQYSSWGGCCHSFHADRFTER